MGQVATSARPLPLDLFPPKEVRDSGRRGLVWFEYADAAAAPSMHEIVVHPGTRYLDSGRRGVRLVLPIHLLPLLGSYWKPEHFRAWSGDAGRLCCEAFAPYQADAAGFLVQREGAYLALPPGAGKTRVLAISADTYRGIRAPGTPILIVAPLFTIDSWQRELQRIGLGAGWTELRGEPLVDPGVSYDKCMADWRRRGLREDARWIFIHPEILDAWEVPLSAYQQPAIVLLDELHLFKTKRADRSRGARIVTARARTVWGASGTPALNRIGELWHQLHLLLPDAFGSEFDFQRAYTGLVRDGEHFVETKADPARLDELRARLVDVVYQRTREECGIKLPPCRWNLVAVDGIEDPSLVHGAKIEYLIEALLSGSGLGQAALPALVELMKRTSRGKIPTTVQLARSLVDQGERVVIGCALRGTVDRIAGKLGHLPGAGGINSGWSTAIGIHGDMPSDTRRRFFDYYLRADVPVLVATYDTIAVGVDGLQHRAHEIIHHDLSYVPAVHTQFTARLWRVGQRHGVTAHVPYARGTLDEVLARTIVDKVDVVASLEQDRADTSLGVLRDLVDRAEIERHAARLRAFREIV